jgi:hypothetical protein
VGLGDPVAVARRAGRGGGVGVGAGVCPVPDPVPGAAPGPGDGAAAAVVVEEEFPIAALLRNVEPEATKADALLKIPLLGGAGLTGAGLAGGCGDAAAAVSVYPGPAAPTTLALPLETGEFWKELAGGEDGVSLPVVALPRGPLLICRISEPALPNVITVLKPLVIFCSSD